MGKLIAKTAAATLAFILAALLLFLGVCSLCFPSVMVGLTNGLGLERACAAYTVNLYEQTGEISDLADAVERCYYSGKYDKAVRYGEELLAADGFEAFCAERDAETAGDEDISSGYHEYITALIDSARALAAEAAA